MRVGLAIMFAFVAMASTSIGATAQDASKDKAPKETASKGTASKGTASKGTMVLLCPQQGPNGKKVNVTCAATEKCCYHPLFDNGSCVPQADGCMGIVNPLPRVQR